MTSVEQLRQRDEQRADAEFGRRRSRDSSRRKSAVQSDWITVSTMTVNPKVTSSELSGVTAKAREEPLQRNAEHEKARHDERERQQRVHPADARELVA